MSATRVAVPKLDAAMFASSAEEMFNDFAERIRELETLAVLRTNPSSEADLRELASGLKKAEAMMGELTRIVEKDCAAMLQAKEVVRRLKATRTRSSKLDRYLQTVANTNEVYSEEIDDNGPENDGNESEAENDDNTISVLQRANETSGPRQVSVPTQKQFDSVPKYMRSVMTYEEFKHVCELVNLAAERKRLILEAPIERLGPNARASLVTWRTQETDDLQNLTFVTEEDVTAELENERGTKIANIKAALQCLRNLDYVRVSPFQHMNRYVFLK